MKTTIVMKNEKAMKNVYDQDFKAYLFFLFCEILHSHFRAST